MTSNPTANATSGNDAGLFRFLELPSEVRNIIYRMVLVEGWPSAGFRIQVNTLVPPALTQVNKQIRAEALPIFYGENYFDLTLPAREVDWFRDEDEEGEDWESYVQEEMEWDAMFNMCKCVSANGGLAYVNQLAAWYSEPTFEDMKNFLFGVELLGSSDNTRGDTESRIGNDALDWADEDAVSAAFHETFERSVGGWFRPQMKERVPIDRVEHFLFMVAQHCHQANRYIELGWDYGH